MALGSLPIMGVDVALIFPWLVAVDVVAVVVSFCQSAREIGSMDFEDRLLRPLFVAILLHHSDLGVAAGDAVVTAATIAILAAEVVASQALGAALYEKEAFPVALTPLLWKQDEKALVLVWCYQPFCWAQPPEHWSLGLCWEVLPEGVAVVAQAEQLSWRWGMKACHCLEDGFPLMILMPDEDPPMALELG